ncbi:MAG: hypothetical protein PHU52_06385, partial [Dehalococcoidales bacterium]|nr:hypothetical protein [Dehalococcoidales bacterium]
IVFYKSCNPRDIALASDYNSFCVPDLILAHNYPHNQLTDKDISCIDNENRLFSPVYGTYVICENAVDVKPPSCDNKGNLFFMENWKECIQSITSVLTAT